MDYRLELCCAHEVLVSGFLDLSLVEVFENTTQTVSQNARRNHCVLGEAQLTDYKPCGTSACLYPP